MTDWARRHVGVLLVGVLIAGIAGAKLLSKALQDHRHYVSPATERRVDATLGLISKSCRRKGHPSPQARRRFRRAVDEYVSLTRRQPDGFTHSGLADNADTTLRYTLFVWAQFAAEGRCAGLQAEARRLVIAELRLEQDGQQHRLHEALKAQPDL